MTRTYGDDYDQREFRPIFEPTARHVRRPFDRRMRARDLEAFDPDVAVLGDSRHHDQHRHYFRVDATGAVASREWLTTRSRGGAHG